MPRRTWTLSATDQDYAHKHPEAYKRYRYASGRTPFLERVWGKDGHMEEKYVKPTDEELKQRLTPLQYDVTR